MKEEVPQIFGVGSEEKGMDKAFEQACKHGRGYRCVWRGEERVQGCRWEGERQSSGRSNIARMVQRRPGGQGTQLCILWSCWGI